MEKCIIEDKLERIEKILLAISQNKNIKYAFVNENSNELWNGHDICAFMQIFVNEFFTLLNNTSFPKCVIQGRDLLDTKWRAGSIVQWIKEQEKS